MSGELPLPERRIDNEAPERMRVELLHAIFALADDTRGIGPSEGLIYATVMGCLGIVEAVNPYGGRCRRASERLRQADWPRVYDVILRLATEFINRDRLLEFRQAVNPVLAAHGVVWDIDEHGKLVRVLPAPAVAQVAAAIQELSDPQLQAARELFAAAQEAFNDVPRRNRDACGNIFDAMEAVGMIRFHGTTFGKVLEKLQAGNAIDRFTIATLRSLELLRHNHFGHGTQRPFSLTPAEVDLVYLACIAGILLLLHL
jgi:hypothetical protein